MDKFTKLLDELNEIGYEADNMDVMELEYSGGNGFVTFVTENLITVRLPFDDWELDMDYIGFYLTFQRRFEIKTPALRYDHLEVTGAEREFGIELKLVTLPDQLIENMKRANEYLAPITVESII